MDNWKLIAAELEIIDKVRYGLIQRWNRIKSECKHEGVPTREDCEQYTDICSHCGKWFYSFGPSSF